MTAAKTAPGVVRCMEITNSPTRVNIESLQSPYTCLHQQPETPETCGSREGANTMKRFIESPAGTPQEPLPAEVPTDADHIVTPRDLRAERLAAELEGRTGHRDPLPVAEQIAKITRKESQK